MIIGILGAVGFTAGQAFGFASGSKLTISGLNIVLGLVAARVMIGPLHLKARIGGILHRRGTPAPIVPAAPGPPGT
jgi:hypothetical protein